MQPKITNKPAFTVVGMLIQTQPMTEAIPNLWMKFAPRIDEVAHWAEPDVSYGLMRFDPQSNVLDYMAGVSVSQVADLPAGMTSWEVPASTYAVFEATLTNIGEVFGYIHGTWSATSEYQQTTPPYFERYDESFNPMDTTSKIEIYIPVEKK